MANPSSTTALGRHPLSRAAKFFASPLSRCVANPVCANTARLFEAYWSILLGKGAGSGWDLQSEVNVAAQFIRGPAPVILDVGANVGEWSQMILKLFPDARLFMFEPQPQCQQIIEQKAIPAEKLYRCAVSSTQGAVELFTTGGTCPTASIHERKDSFLRDRQFSTIQVPTMTIDQMVQENELAEIDFIKIDVEGHELDVLQGARTSLSRGMIRAVAFEFGSSNINSRTYFRDFWDTFSEHGYALFRILPSSRLLPLFSYSEDCEHFRGVSNYVAAKRPAPPPDDEAESPVPDA